MSTKAVVGQFKGRPVLQIFNTDKDGKTEGQPVITFGITKAKALQDHADDIKRFIETYSSSVAKTVDVSKLSTEEKNKLLAELLAN